MAVTKRQAEQAFRQFKQQFAPYLPPEDYAYGPKLIHNWDWLESGPTTWAIVWEEGPEDWAMYAETGGKFWYNGVTVPAAKRWPKGTFAEAVTGWSIGIHLV